MRVWGSAGALEEGVMGCETLLESWQEGDGIWDSVGGLGVQKIEFGSLLEFWEGDNWVWDTAGTLERGITGPRIVLMHCGEGDRVWDPLGALGGG